MKRRPAWNIAANRGQWPSRRALRGGRAGRPPVPGARRPALRLACEPIRHPHWRPQRLPRPRRRPAAAQPAAVAPAPYPYRRGCRCAVRGHQLRVRFVGADVRTPLLPSQAHRRGAQLPARQRPRAVGPAPCPATGRCATKRPWPGVAARFYENATQHLEYDFEVAAGADAGRVQLRYEGATSLTLSARRAAARGHLGGRTDRAAPRTPTEPTRPPGRGRRWPAAAAWTAADGAGDRFELGPTTTRRPLTD
ncbi:MAG: hypothetical protein WKG07_03525 [Hymenobacter sp.]